MSNSVIDFEKIKDLEFESLKGKINPLREYVITLGQSNSSKGVMFVLYSYLSLPFSFLHSAVTVL